MYTGFPSAQNKIRTIPSAGSPTMSGTVTSRKQNGWWAPPTELSSSIWTNVGNTTTTGWVVGGMNTTGSHSGWIADVHVKDTPRGYDGYLSPDGGFASYRFWCSEDEERCYFPNGEEAGV
ncbi:hypothetical protein QFZ21_004219 [Microbacterium sp. W4I20]|nr:hypothetical protein [Microbacterium sp. W4I20]